MHLTREGDVTRLDFDFHGHAGYAIGRAKVDLDLPDNYQIVFRIRGEAPRENLELKLLRGDDVWWLNRREFAFPRNWTAVKTKKRQIGYAWGPAGGGELRHAEGLEIVVTAGSGGKGTVWFSDPVVEPLPPTPTEPVTFKSRTIDLGSRRELGGLIVDWVTEPAEYKVLLDGVAGLQGSRVAGHSLHAEQPSNPATEQPSFIWLPDAEAKTIEIRGGQVRSVTVEPPSWAPTVNDFYTIVAKAAPRGTYPRYLIGEQAYWTVVGSDDGEHEALIGEDGSVEPFKGGFSLEPFLIAGGKRLTWADVTTTQTLAEGDLPIPSVTWKHGDVAMTVTAAVSDSSMLQLRYKVKGKAALHLQARPFQVNPSTQFLNLQGGYAPIDEALFRRIWPRTKPARVEGHTFIYTSSGQATNDIEIDIQLAKGATRQPFATIARGWRERLRRVAVDIPAAPEIGDTVRTSIAYMLIHRDGAALQPGSRAYERAWIRDGALMAAALLRLGHADAARRFASWYATYQYPDGKVPCCVDARGADPVPENDSHGELIYLVAEIWRLTHDRALTARLWPQADAAAKFIDLLRSQNHGQFEGLVTESISHEGYSAKPMHSYWDDFFALRGLDDAVMLARVLGHDARAAELESSAASMRRDLAVSIRRTIETHHIDFIPGAAELGDFDATSTAIGISPLNLQSLLPPAELRHTFDRYLEGLSKPRDDYTPYEMRIIGALIRLGDSSHTAALVERFLKDRRPPAWNGWGEVVRTELRKPGFIGDMPHAWVASDFVRSILDAVVYEEADGTLVVGAGIPREWLAKPLHVGPIATEHGTIDIRARAYGDRVTFELTGTAKPPRLIVGGKTIEPRLPATVVVTDE
jgi:hypothetical protein